MKWNIGKSKATIVDSILYQEEAINESQKQELRKMLQRYEGRQLKDEEFRILQGVLLKDFGDRELQKKERKALEKQKKNLRMTAKSMGKRVGSAFSKIGVRNAFAKGLKFKT